MDQWLQGVILCMLPFTLATACYLTSKQQGFHSPLRCPVKHGGTLHDHGGSGSELQHPA